MTISVKFFASLREQVGKGESSLTYTANLTVEKAWAESSSMTMPANTLCAVNMEYVDRKQTLHDGDEVAFFPPVTGG